MALTSTMYRFAIELSDVDRGVYAPLDLRVPMHPSETPRRMLARVLALSLHYEEGIAMGRGLSNVDEPAVWEKDLQGRVLHWIDVGLPAPDRLHRASKLADRVSVYLYEPAPHWIKDLTKATVHRKDELEVWVLPSALLEGLEAQLDRKVGWSVTRSDSVLYVEADGQSFEGTPERLTF
ncbi:MAG: YaeQ family protein [Sandaracinaceae bacterium]